ncbi:MAG: universal stress protein [Chthoniobacterales bacterium]|nr:universal stress protein [Chthoniobacterales bacterium]
MKTLLVAVDLSPVSSQILKTAAALAKPLGAKVVLLHVVTPLSSCVPIGSGMDVASIPMPLTAQEIEELLAQLETLAASVKTHGLSVKCIVKEALPIEEIKEQATLHHTDIIVVGSHGHGGLYHLFNGSVVTSLLKEAKHPILVVPVEGR